MHVLTAMNISKLNFYMSTAQSGTDSCTIVVQQATGGCTGTFSDTTLTCTVLGSGPTQACSDTTNTVSVGAGDCLQISFVENAGTCTGFIGWSFEGVQ